MAITQGRSQLDREIDSLVRELPSLSVRALVDLQAAARRLLLAPTLDESALEDLVARPAAASTLPRRRHPSGNGAGT